MTFEFNEDGSLKLPEETIQNKQEERDSIVLRRVQVNINNPAIAQLKIECPESMVNPGRIANLYREINKGKFPSVESTAKWVGKKIFVIEARGSWKMYSLLEYLLECLREELEKDNKVLVRGVWDKFDS